MSTVAVAIGDPTANAYAYTNSYSFTHAPNSYPYANSVTHRHCDGNAQPNPNSHSSRLRLDSRSAAAQRVLR